MPISTASLVSNPAEDDRKTLGFRDALHESLPEYRPLSQDERETLVSLNNRAANWGTVLVTDGFDPSLVRGCSFYGTVRIGRLESAFLQYHDLTLPVGLHDSLIISSDIGDNAVIRNVGFLSRYVVGPEVMLFNIDEMGTTDHAKFGNGIVMEGESEDVRIELEIANENGGRAILPFDGLETGDAWLWSHYRGNLELQRAFARMTEAQFDTRRGAYGRVGPHAVIKSCRIIKDVVFGPHAYVKGANKLKNLTIKSDRETPTQIGEGVELVNGIIERGCRIFYGVKAVRFVMRTNTCLKYGARLINSVLGDNGTISCCEVLNSLVLPGHEQHHNNSFLCAATLLGQSNIAAGATIGSNHNSRANDGELVAGRGFWPGLSVTLKHSSRFASFCLIAKGSYPAELCVPLAFTLVATEPDRLVLRPAFWFLYNMYALARNSWKYGDRDAKLYRYHSYEYDYLAPDTVDEIWHTINILETWVGAVPSGGSEGRLPEDSFAGLPFDTSVATDLASTGRRRLDQEAVPSPLVIHGAGIEKWKRPLWVYDLQSARQEYLDMATLYAVRTLCGYLADGRPVTLNDIDRSGLVADETPWYNVGGQLVRRDDHDALLGDIVSGRLSSWREVHERYAEVAERYSVQRAGHALSVLHRLFGSEPTERCWEDAKRKAVAVQRTVAERTAETRKKDYRNRFRSMMYDSPDEEELVVGRLEENSFIDLITRNTEEFARLVEEGHSRTNRS